MKKVLIIFGTRPEAIKMAPVIKTFKNDFRHFDVRICTTGQHKELLHQVLNVFSIIPDFDLSIMKRDQDLFDITASVLTKIKNVLNHFRPDMVLVHGDTTSSMAAALAAFYNHIPVGHIEAGLRTNNIYSPFPEEINRQITGRMASVHFAPTETAKNNLLRENIPAEKIVVTGNTVIDALFMALEIVDSKGTEVTDYLKGIIPPFSKNKIVLVTGHRRENIGPDIESICLAVNKLANRFPDVHFVYPVHLNPNIYEAVHRILYMPARMNVHLIKPLDYLSFVALMNEAYIILTDSGGVQEEAPGLGKPVLVTRKITERPEGLETGIVKLVGASEEKIVDEISRLLQDNDYYKKTAEATNPYGDGKASARIVKFIEAYLS